MPPPSPRRAPPILFHSFIRFILQPRRAPFHAHRIGTETPLGDLLAGAGAVCVGLFAAVCASDRSGKRPSATRYTWRASANWSASGSSAPLRPSALSNCCSKTSCPNCCVPLAWEGRHPPRCGEMGLQQVSVCRACSPAGASAISPPLPVHFMPTALDMLTR